MKTVSVSASRKYDIQIGPGLLDTCGGAIRALSSSERIAIVSDDIVAPLYLGRLEAALREAGFAHTPSFVFAHGEKSKTLATASEIYEFLAKNKITRTDLVIALGGGVVGDVTGFAASTFLRGIRSVQIPSTLLAQVDSSVGGKTAVDLPSGKNLVGTFCQPSLVICDTRLLDTLSREQFSDGAAEVIKYGAIRDRSLFNLVSNPGYEAHMEEMIHRCISIKRDIVEGDEFDTGERMLLNFGHTLAHAIETKSDYSIPHGTAVAIGMVMITRASARAGITPETAVGELERANGLFDLPVSTDMECTELVRLCGNDKKRSDNQIHAIVLEQIGRATIRSMPFGDFQRFICEGNS